MPLPSLLKTRGFLGSIFPGLMPAIKRDLGKEFPGLGNSDKNISGFDNVFEIRLIDFFELLNTCNFLKHVLNLQSFGNFLP